jgi:hypothetical protein
MEKEEESEAQHEDWRAIEPGQVGGSYGCLWDCKEGGEVGGVTWIDVGDVLTGLRSGGHPGSDHCGKSAMTDGL